AHDRRMTRVVHERREWLLFIRVESRNEDFAVARTIRIHTEKALAGGSDGAAVCVDVALAAARSQANRLQIGERFGCGLRRPAGQVIEPGRNHFVTFLYPALIWYGTRMRMGCAGSDILDRQTRGLAHGNAKLICSLVGKNLDVTIENDSGGHLV